MSPRHQTEEWQSHPELVHAEQAVGRKRYQELRRAGRAISEKERKADRDKPGLTQTEALAIQRRYGL